MNINVFIEYFVIAASLSLCFGLFVMKKAKSWGAMSHVDARRRSQKSVPLLGGMAIYLGALLVFVFSQYRLPLNLLLAALPVLVVGSIDDFYELSARPKFSAQTISSILWVMLVPRGQLMLEQVGMHHTVAVFVTAFWIIGIINSINMSDGMDGLAGGISSIIFMALALLSLGSSEMTVIAITLSGACVGFLFHNLPPAKMYLGDSGSSLLGFCLGAVASIMPVKTSGAVAIFIPLLLFSLPLTDTILAICRRIYRQRPVFRGDHSHIHHKLLRLGFTVKQAMILLYAVTFYAAFAAFLMQSKPIAPSVMILCCSSIGLMTVLVLVLTWEHIFEKHVSLFSHSIMSEHLVRHNVRTGIPKPYPGIIINMKSIYKETASFTPEDTAEFANEISSSIKKHFPQGLFKATNKNSILVFFEAPKLIESEVMSRFREELRDLFRKFQVMESEDETLEDSVVCLFNQERFQAEESRKRAA